MFASQKSAVSRWHRQAFYLVILGMLFYVPGNIIGDNLYIPFLGIILFLIIAARRVLIVDAYVLLLLFTAILYVSFSHLHLLPRVMRFYVDDIINRQAGQYPIFFLLSLIFFPIADELKAGLFDRRHYAILFIGSYLSYILFYKAFALAVDQSDLPSVEGFKVYGFTLYGFTAPVMLCQLAWFLL